MTCQRSNVFASITPASGHDRRVAPSDSVACTLVLSMHLLHLEGMRTLRHSLGCASTALILQVLKTHSSYNESFGPLGGFTSYGEALSQVGECFLRILSHHGCRVRRHLLFLYFEASGSRAEGSHVVAAVDFYTCATSMPVCWNALRGWAKLIPQGQRLQIRRVAVAAISTKIVSAGQLMMAAATMSTFMCYLRPGDMMKFRFRYLLVPLLNVASQIMT